MQVKDFTGFFAVEFCFFFFGVFGGPGNFVFQETSFQTAKFSFYQNFFFFLFLADCILLVGNVST